MITCAETRIWCRLDRILVNEEWIQSFTSSQVEYLEPICSDHSPALISIEDENFEGKKPFKIFKMWTKHSDFLTVVKSVWELDIRGYRMYKFYSKLKALKPALKDLNRKHFMNISEQVIRAKQKANIKWDLYGDKCSQFFHSMMKARRHHNRVLSIYSENGERITEMPRKVDEFVGYYKKLLGSSTTTDIPDPEVISNDPILSSSQRDGLCSPISREEIKLAIFSMPDGKAPGPDGFNASFFKAAWSVISEDPFLAVEEFFQTGKLLGAINATGITLVPKTLNPKTPSDFRPISCCNCIYKIITKILASRIQNVMGFLISDAQSAFVKGRSILPVRYLGVPLISKRLSCLDCSALLSRISEKFQNWQKREVLSYAERLQLIKSVILGIHIFWTNNYILPSKVLRKIDNLCSEFLWNRKIPLVSWNSVCQNKKQGGLGVFSARIWNQAAAIKIMWLIHLKKDHLWVKWVHGNYLSHANVWQVQVKVNDSWMWKQIIKMRDMLIGKLGSIENLKNLIDSYCVNGKFVVSAVYEKLNHSSQQVAWSATVWDSLHYPKHSFILCWKHANTFSLTVSTVLVFGTRSWID
ncbi:uncharacterized protein LOC109820923 [Asparagus officinalis]|uniref:uncharacterized protein LOC109820923 n=1 Tax=Asparagus officinalis TaxID=4686 RepID=UPI00098E8195|nr:uncharacterized protein LOC109820923 [Asparagus officinalis]